MFLLPISDTNKLKITNILQITNKLQNNLQIIK